MDVSMGLQIVRRLGREPMLEPLLREILNEHFRVRCVAEIVPKFWNHFTENMSPEETLNCLLVAVGELQRSVEATSCTAAFVDAMPGTQPAHSLMDTLLRVLHTSLSISVPPFFYRLVEDVLSHSVRVWEEGGAGKGDGEKGESMEESGSADDSMDADGDGDKWERENDGGSGRGGGGGGREGGGGDGGGGGGGEGDGGGGEGGEERGEQSGEEEGGRADFWKKFSELVVQLRSLQLLHFFADSAVAEVVYCKVKTHVGGRCSQEFDSPMLEDTISSLEGVIMGWLGHVYGDSEDVQQQWLPRVQYFGYETFAELRIGELFDILVEYPDSEPALHDLRVCTEKVDCRDSLISSLRSTFERRLLHPGANTADIITQYISSIKGLRLLDPSGVVLEQVCDPVRAYLTTREDTVRCIVASLTDDSSNELADGKAPDEKLKINKLGPNELVSGEPVLVDLSEESDGEDQDFDSWKPDPVDADPTKTSKSRQTSDIISLLVNIYGSREMFVNEYRNLLADRLLQSLNYDISREVRNLELLKLRFGESNLHFCEVMMKDIVDSRRINTHILSQLQKERKEEEEEEDEIELSAFILSHIFWPTFREEKLKLPEIFQNKLDHYCKVYQSVKGLRTLEWKPHLGLVQVDLELVDRELSLSVSPIRAAIIHLFQDQSTWTVDALSSTLEAQPSVVRRHLGFWVGQGVLKEHPTDSFTVVEEQQEEARGTSGGDVDDEEESAMASAEEQKESELQVFWSYIVGMLTNLGKLPLDRIHTMLRMFAMQGQGGKECSPAELKVFLDRKVREQQLVCSGGAYQLAPKMEQ